MEPGRYFPAPPFVILRKGWAILVERAKVNVDRPMAAFHKCYKHKSVAD